MLYDFDPDVLIDNAKLDELAYLARASKVALEHRLNKMEEYAEESYRMMLAYGIVPTGRASFIHEHHAIYSPFLSACSRLPVDPIGTYGIKNIMKFEKDMLTDLHNNS